MLTILIPHCNRSCILSATLELTKLAFVECKDINILVSDNSTNYNERVAAIEICKQQNIELTMPPSYLPMVPHWSWLLNKVDKGFVTILPERRFATIFMVKAYLELLNSNYKLITYSHNALVVDKNKVWSSRNHSLSMSVISMHEAQALIRPSFEDKLPQVYNSIISADSLKDWRARGNILKDFDIVRGISPDINFAIRYSYNIQNISDFLLHSYLYYDAPCVASFDHRGVKSNGQHGDGRRHMSEHNIFGFSEFPKNFVNPTGGILGEIIYEVGMGEFYRKNLHIACIPYLLMEVTFSKSYRQLKANCSAVVNYFELLGYSLPTYMGDALTQAVHTAIRRLEESNDTYELANHYKHETCGVAEATYAFSNLQRFFSEILK